VAEKREPIKQTWFKTPWKLVSKDGEVAEGVDQFGAWPKQIDFMTAAERFVCFGGARGPGKTVAMAQVIKNTMIRWSGIEVLVLRKDLQDLKRTTMAEFIRATPKQFLDRRFGGQWNKAENWVRYPNGSIAYFGELKDWESYKSMTLGKIFIDEANEVEEDAFVNLEPTLRWTTGEGLCKLPECAALGEEWVRDHPVHPRFQIVMATNPAPGWIKKRFWEPFKAGHERPRHRFIAATAFDNPSLPPEFIPSLLENHSATWVQNYIYGDWASFENMVWERWNRGVHLWRGPVPYGEFTRVDGGIDYGGTTKDAHRTAAYLTGWLPDGRLVTFWEYSQQGAASADFFAKIKLVTQQYRVDGWDADSSQHRANELLRDAGVPVFDAPGYKGAVRDGINQVDRLLTLDATKRPQLYVVEENCPRLVSGIETYQLDPETGEPAKNQEDDEVNGWRYNIMRVTKYRATGQNRELNVTGGSVTSRSSKPSSILTQVRNQRRERLRKFIERTERTA